MALSQNALKACSIGTPSIEQNQIKQERPFFEDFVAVFGNEDGIQEHGKLGVSTMRATVLNHG